MKFSLATTAILALGIGILPNGLADARTASAKPSSQRTFVTQRTASPVSVIAGQTLYDRNGAEVGMINAVKTDMTGKQKAVVGIGTFLGLHTKNVQIPASKLAAREAGGYAASLTAAEIKNLPEVEDNSTYR
ncbi:MAG TPA: hypothetical protein VLT91_10855 [Rhizomicrobium sp.]|nr:hypothetical protein [Rhizomicrobium sp.]